MTLPVTVEGDLERYEGMLVTITGRFTVSQNYFLGRYGQVTLSAHGRLLKPTNVFRPDTRQARALADENARRRIVLDDGQASEGFFSGVENPDPIPYLGADGTLRAGDTVDDLTGVIDSGRVTSGTGLDAVVDYRLHPTIAPVFARVNHRPMRPPEVGGRIKIASFNLLNYFTTFRNGQTADGAGGHGCLPSGTTADCRGADNRAEFLRQSDKIVRAIAAMDADVVGLVELQRNAGLAARTLVRELNAFLGSRAYAVVPDPAEVGSDAIQVAMIYKPASLALVGRALSDADPLHPRAPLAQTFRAKGGRDKFSVIVNHFKSKNCDGAEGDDLDQSDGQGCYNDRRKREARALLSFIEQVKATAGDDVIVVGDLNAYAKEDPIDLLLAGGLEDQVLRFDGPGAYSYVFDGEAGALDHALATASMAARITGAAHWHINADEPSVIDYNTEFKTQDLYSASPYRSSDHDPLLVGFDPGRIRRRAALALPSIPAAAARRAAPSRPRWRGDSSLLRSA
jgi:predicted extracellular nuclease